MKQEKHAPQNVRADRLTHKYTNSMSKSTMSNRERKKKKKVQHKSAYVRRQFLPEQKQDESHKVDYLCVLDFEATCTAKGVPRPQEIIEFPTLLLNVKTNQVESVFHYYIKPDVHPTLSEFCTELTGIQQETVDKGISLQEALGLHEEWLTENDLVPWQPNENNGNSDSKNKTFLYLTCGDWDLETCLPRQLQYHSMKVPSHFKAWINVKTAFKERHGTKMKGMRMLLNHFGLEMEGRHHSGIDDCHNIARACQSMLAEGWVPSVTSVLELKSDE